MVHRLPHLRHRCASTACFVGLHQHQNPYYPDTMYIDALIGPETVNTMPPQTVDAFRDHGKLGCTLPKDLDQAREQLAQLANLGVDLSAITEQLQRDGRSFAAFDFAGSHRNKSRYLQAQLKCCSQRDDFRRCRTVEIVTRHLTVPGLSAKGVVAAQCFDALFLTFGAFGV